MTSNEQCQAAVERSPYRLSGGGRSHFNYHGLRVRERCSRRAVFDHLCTQHVNVQNKGTYIIRVEG